MRQRGRDMAAAVCGGAIRRWRRAVMLTVLAMGLATGLLLSAFAGAAFAHAALVSVEPADGSVIATPPRAFAITFNEPTSPVVLELVRPDGAKVSLLRRFKLHDATLDIEAPGNLGNGTYVLSWRVISEDGHPVGGSAVFSIGAPSAGGAPVPVETANWSLMAGIWLTKLVLYLGLFAGVGGTFFIGWIGGGARPVRRILSALTVAGLAAAILSVGLQGLDELGLSWPDLAAPQVWTTGFSGTYGATAVLAAISLALALMVLCTKGLEEKTLSLAAFLGVGFALAMSGHASTAHPQWLTRPAVFLHALGIAFWAGSLLPLGMALAGRMPDKAPDARAVLSRFSRVIPFAVAPLVLAGVTLAIVQLGSVEALWTTAYGQVLLVKFALLVVLFALAAINREWLTKPSLGGDRTAIRRLHRSIRVEIVLMMAIFAAVAVWRFTPPPRAMAEAAAAPAFVHIHTAKAMAAVTVTPGHAGPVRVSIEIMAGDDKPLAAKEVTLIMSNPAAGVEQIRRSAAKAADGTWQVDKLVLPRPGKWSVRVDVLVSDFDMVMLRDQIEIRP